MSTKVVWSLGCCAILNGSLLLAGATPATESSPGVASALSREMAADAEQLDRRLQLREARNDERNDAAWWQSGFVSSSSGWQSWEASSLVDADLLRRYQQKRDEAQSTAAAQLKLADWCRDQGLADQERAHLIQALKTGQAANPHGILKRLGYRQVGPHWFTETDLKSAAEESFRLMQTWKKLRPRLEKLAIRLEAKPNIREKATVELRAFADPASIPILEQSLGTHSPTTAQAVVDMLSEMDSYRASQSLARFAIGSPWAPIREAATAELKQRPLEEFVPMALAMMHDPIEVSLQIGDAPRNILRNPEGGREWRFTFAREGRETIEVAALRVIDCRFIPMTTEERVDRRSFRQELLSNDTARNSLDVLQAWIESADRLNDFGEEMNGRVGELLAATSGAEPSAKPQTWWAWWDQLTDAPRTEPKTQVSVETQLVKIEAPIQKSCLVAGTPVWTEEGFRPIEDIRIGDRVLSKNIETGELKYQPVLHTTHRAGATVSDLKVGDETIAASLGHNFWISGRGWTRTNQMRDGMPAHTPTGTVRLEVREETRTADVYNLVVADFHTYFVGKSMLLGHDVIVPAPTDVRVPGLDPQMAAAK